MMIILLPLTDYFKDASGSYYADALGMQKDVVIQTDDEQGSCSTSAILDKEEPGLGDAAMMNVSNMGLEAHGRGMLVF